MKLHTGVFVFLFAHSVMRKLPEGLIIEAFLVLGRSPKLQPDKEPCKDSQRHTQSDGDEETTDVKYSKPDRYCVII